MSTTRLLILGVVRIFQPVHGYDVRRELLSWGADKWANVQPGSIYHAVRKMTEEELLSEVATDQTPVYVNWLWELAVVRSEAEIGWCERIADRIESGTPLFKFD